MRTLPKLILGSLLICGYAVHLDHQPWQSLAYRGSGRVAPQTTPPSAHDPMADRGSGRLQSPLTDAHDIAYRGSGRISVG
jgi:hypothetical protein